MLIPSFIVLLKSFLFKAVTLLALAQVVKVYIELCLRMSTSLLRFNYRGFDWLDKKNTIFGKITGDSIFNLLSLGEAETNKNDDWPLDPPPRITSVENSSEGETTRDVQLSVKEALSSKKGTLSMKEAPGSKKEAPRRDF
uniref:Uncharacterized protein n=1 Tax=Populus alba TaxID=43335 RepID=A0A4U5PR70_POPAL|nr:hypothetical protein D5086_0000191090 [Populus alba]